MPHGNRHGPAGRGRQAFERPNKTELNQGQKLEIRPGDMNDGVTVDSDRYVSLWDITGAKTTWYAPGAGPQDERFAFGHSDLDLRDNAAAPGAELNGSLRWALYADTDMEVLVRQTPVGSAQTLRNAETETGKDKHLVPLWAPSAKEDMVLALEFKADSADDGLVFDVTNTTADAGIAYSQYK